MPALGVVVIVLASHTLLLLAAISVCAVAAECMALKLGPAVQIRRRLRNWVAVRVDGLRPR